LSVNFFIGICSEDEKEFKFDKIKTSEYLNFFIWKKKVSYFTLNRIVIISKSVYYNLYIYFLISYKILIWLPLLSYAWKATTTKKDKNVHAVFYQVGFILIMYGEYNGN
jgi:hypothetical protein